MADFDAGTDATTVDKLGFAIAGFAIGDNVTTEALFVFHNSDLGNAAVYYDSNPGVAGGAILVAELDSIALLGGLSAFDSGDFQFVLMDEAMQCLCPSFHMANPMSRRDIWSALLNRITTSGVTGP